MMRAMYGRDDERQRDDRQHELLAAASTAAESGGISDDRREARVNTIVPNSDDEHDADDELGQRGQCRAARAS